MPSYSWRCIKESMCNETFLSYYVERNITLVSYNKKTVLNQIRVDIKWINAKHRILKLINDL